MQESDEDDDDEDQIDNAAAPDDEEEPDDDDDDMQLSMDDSSVRLTKSLDNNWDLEVDMSQPVELPARRLAGGKGGSSSGFSFFRLRISCESEASRTWISW